MTSTPLAAAVVDTPVGALAVITNSGVVVASGFTSVEDQHGRLPEEVRRLGLVNRRDPGLAIDAVHAYLAGELDALNAVPVHQPGGRYTQQVWQVMRTIPAGQTWTYGQLAASSGRPDAARAVGQACARNLVAPFVPCHRVVRAGGGLGGYYYGLGVKRWLLDHERVPGQMSLPA
jgi:methylated-DNA-[protein]-cysteine S-methyltransferase